MSDINEVFESVVLAQQATGIWHTPTHENGLMKLKSLDGDMELRVDATPTQANIFPVEYGVAENEWVYLNADDINEGIATMVKEIRQAS